jgi:dihydropteroate synthase
MGIVNLTPDSFYPASRLPEPAAAVAAALQLATEGADLLDLGAASSRPGAAPVPPWEEQRRLLPVLEALKACCDLPLTVDTCCAETAERALDAGADAINDISAGTADPGLLGLVAGRGCGLVLMHMQGSPGTMQEDPCYEDVVAEVKAYLAAQASAAEGVGVRPERIVVDPGIGFGKKLEHNLALLAALPELAGGRPLLLGASRKSFIGHLTGAPVEERLGGSLAALAAAHGAGVTLVRVHDVAASVQFLDTLAAIGNAAGDV